ncbi:hypothetical protein NSQ59_27770 [Margalitia sp. FSL K6-0131]|uniref:hypothetical protein n=1 Tax=Margalitia sp. FSL K6-0131 TaxID=2954604 RepID=UPI0030F7729C
MTVFISALFGGLLGCFLSTPVLITLFVVSVVIMLIVLRKVEYIFILVGVAIFITAIKFLPPTFTYLVEITRNSHHKGLIIGIFILIMVSILFLLYKVSKWEENETTKKLL